MGLSKSGSGNITVAAVLAAVFILALTGPGSAQTYQTGPAFERTFSPVTPENRAHLKMLRPMKTGLWSMNISVRKPLRNVSVSISPLPNSSTSVPAPEDMVYRYLNVSSGKLDSSTLSRIDLVVPVNRSWIRGVNESSIRLNILEDSGWKTLETRRYREEERTVLYTASTSSISYFAVTAESRPATGIPVPVTVLAGLATVVLVFVAYLLYSRTGGTSSETREVEQRLGSLMQEIEKDLRERPVHSQESLNSQVERASELIEAEEYEQAGQILEQVKNSIEKDDY